LAFGAGNAKVVHQCGCVQERAAIFQRLHEKPSALISETREKSPARERQRERGARELATETVFPHSNLKINVENARKADKENTHTLA